MFMNPATMTGFRTLTIDTNYTFGVPTTKINATSNNPGYNALFSPNSGDVGLDYFVPASYIVYPFSEKIYLGISLNTTYGNSTKAENVWAGSLFASTSKLRIITATPSIAYKLNDMISFGFGVQIQYASARQTARFRALRSRRSLAVSASPRLMAGASASLPVSRSPRSRAPRSVSAGARWLISASKAPPCSARSPATIRRAPCTFRTA